MRLDVSETWCSVPAFADVEPCVPFAQGWQYWQVDLGGRDVVEQLGSFYSGEPSSCLGERATRVVAEIDSLRAQQPEQVAVYLHREEWEDRSLVAWIYEGRPI